jgi:hypothetical protein
MQDLVGRDPCKVPKEQKRSPHQSGRERPLHGLATAKQVPLNRSRLQARVFRMRQANLWSTEMPSGAEGLTQPRPTSQMRGAASSMQHSYTTDTQSFLTAFGMGLMQAFGPSLAHSPPPTNRPSINSSLSSTSSYKSNSKRAVTSAQSLSKRRNFYSGHSKPPLSASYQNLGSQANTASSRTSLPPTPHPRLSPPSTVPSTQTSTPAHGAPSPLSAFLYHVYRRARKLQYAMSKRCTEQSQSGPNSGQDSSSAYKKTTSLPSTPATALASPLVEACTASWATLELKSCASTALLPSQSGWMTIYSSEYCDPTSRHIIYDADSGPRTSQRTEGKFMMEAGFGSGARPCPTTVQKNLTKMLPLPSKTSPGHPKGKTLPHLQQPPPYYIYVI